jgi:hypothetical protein
VTLTGGTAAYADKNAGNAKAVSLTGASLSGADAGNYSLGSVTDVTANITPMAVSGAFTADDKVYDGTNVATIATRTIPAMVGGDAVALTGGAATFSNKNVGEDKTVTPNAVSNWSLTGADAGNYNLTSINTTSADITKRTLVVTATITTKVYDTTVSATVGELTTDKLPLNGVSVTHGPATFANKTAGVGKVVTLVGLTLSGPEAGNYELPSTTLETTGTITKAPLTLNFLVAGTKVYDATNAATVTAASLSGILGNDIVDNVVVGTLGATYNNKNVGTNKPITIASYAPTGTDAGNYEVTSFSPQTANITRKSVTASFTASNKVYDGTSAATVAGSTIGGLIGEDAVSLSGTAVFSNKNAGVGKTVSIASPTLTGADAANYVLTGGAGTATANITKRTLTPVYAVSDKLFDGTTAADASLISDDRVAGDVLTFSYDIPANFEDASIGTNKPVTISNIVVGGADASNYNLDASPNDNTVGANVQVVLAAIINNPPVVATSSGATEYTLSTTAVVIDPEVNVTDVESTLAEDLPSFAGGFLRVSIASGIDTSDRLSISHEGNGEGQIGVDLGTAEVLYSGIVIGTFTVGSSGSPLVVTFNANANVVSVQALARRISFANSNVAESIEDRVITFEVSDGLDNGLSVAIEKGITIGNSLSLPPVLTTGTTTATNFIEGSTLVAAAPVRISTLMTVTDPDDIPANQPFAFNGGVLTVRLSVNGTADDRLGIFSSTTASAGSPAINVLGDEVRVFSVNNDPNPVVIGTFTGGVGTEPLRVTLNANATVARTQLLLRAITFQNVSNAPSTLDRSVEFVLNDGQGASSDPVTRTVTVTATNDAPTVTLDGTYSPVFTEPLGVTTDATASLVAVQVDTGIILVDPDLTNLGGGNVTVRTTVATANASDRFGIAALGGITISAGALSTNTTVSFNGVVFGTVTQTTNSRLEVTFNNNANSEMAQALARAFTFRHISDLPGAVTREIIVTLKESATGLVSANTTKTLTVVATNDAPRITGNIATVTGKRGTFAAIFSASTTSFVDPFNLLTSLPTTMNGGSLNVSMSVAADITLNVTAGNGITIAGNVISHTQSGVTTAFATLDATDTGVNRALKINFNANATAFRIEQLLKQLRVNVLGTAALGARTVTTTMLEPDSDSVSVTSTVNVTA